MGSDARDPHRQSARPVKRWRSATAGVAVALPLVLVYGFRLTYNTTASLPPGVYQVRELRGAPARGDIVGFCLEGDAARLAVSRGYVYREALERYVYGTRCASGAAPIGKPVAGVPGDTVEMRGGGVWINGVPLANGRVLVRDRAGREMPRPRRVRRVLGPDEYWLQSTHSARSFDSRYYGPARREQIIDRRVPVCGALSSTLREVAGSKPRSGHSAGARSSPGS